jgi:repressor LexA
MADYDDLSDRQRTLMGFIEEYFDTYGRPPTNREIGNGLGIPSTGHVDYHLKALEKKGFIARESRTSRGIRIIASVREPLPDLALQPPGIPIYGTIAAGVPLDLVSGHRDVLDMVNPQAFSPKAFALRVKGDSMIEDGIFDGDYVVIEPVAKPHTREIIVATTNNSAGESGAATLKRFFQEGKRIKLQPANSEMDPIYVDAKEWDRYWQVQGRLAMVLRTYDNKKA